MGIAEPSKPVRKRFGGLVVTLTREGILLKGYRRRRSRLVTWEQLCRLACETNPPPKPGWTAEEWNDCRKMLSRGK